MAISTHQTTLFRETDFPEVVRSYPMMRYMGSKYRLLPWLHSVLAGLEFDTALDAFSGSGCVGYMLKGMGKEVRSADFLNFPTVIARALVENPGIRLGEKELADLLTPDESVPDFIERTFTGIFFTPEDLRFLDLVSWNIRKLPDPYMQSLAVAAMIRSCAKRQPRGVFTVAGDPEKYKDGRRDLALSLREHFPEQVEAYNNATFDNGRANRAVRADVFSIDTDVDLVYLDPPYVPRADDNCYMKRYHFLEGLSCYWEGVEIMEESRVRKIEKPYTPFSYRRTAIDAFDRMFSRFSESTIVLSYSSNGYPDLQILTDLLGGYKKDVVVHERDHRYHFGTHGNATRNSVTEYLIVGS